MSDDTQRTDLAGLRVLAEEAVPGPWKECGHGHGGCKCGTIWATTFDAPVADAVIGEWGDRWPELRRTEGDKYEVYMEKSIYGEVDERKGKANAAFIAAADPTTVMGLLDEIDRLRARVEELEAARAKAT